jgi:hypothetical protein
LSSFTSAKAGLVLLFSQRKKMLTPFAENYDPSAHNHRMVSLNQNLIFPAGRD